MFKKSFWSAAVMGAVLSVGVCSTVQAKPAAATPVQKAAAQLEQGGTFYMVSDIDALKPQLSRILDAYAATLPDGKVKTLDVEFVQVRSVLELICKYTGLDRVQAYGASSTVLAPEDSKQKPVYHNRSVLIMDCSEPEPLLVRLLDGEKTSLQAFAARVPDDAVLAGVFNFNTVEILGLLKSIPQLPPEMLGELEKEIKNNFNCSLEEFSKGISGKVEVIVCSLDITQEIPRVMISVPDKGNRIFGVACQTFGQDPAKAERAVIDEDVIVCKQADRLVLYLGKGVQEWQAKKLAAGETLAKDKEFARYAAKLPAEANAYGVSRVGYLMDRSEGIVSLGAVVFDKDGMVCYSNDSFDYNGQMVAIIFSALKTLEELPIKNMLP
ncbi:MAG: hypothetical protein E7047_02675 [Lentisphaerae bacterium]|nr:hypothetical protein [Lentisphaerota bacterium]